VTILRLVYAWNEARSRVFFSAHFRHAFSIRHQFGIDERGRRRS
jgi:hypothetical protein